MTCIGRAAGRRMDGGLISRRFEWRPRSTATAVKIMVMGGTASGKHRLVAAVARLQATELTHVQTGQESRSRAGLEHLSGRSAATPRPWASCSED